MSGESGEKIPNSRFVQRCVVKNCIIVLRVRNLIYVIKRS